MTDTTVPHVRITSPGQLVATVPALLGFRPTESLVVVLLEGRLVRCTMRVDITDGVLAQAEQIVAVAQRAEATSVLLVVYSTTTGGLPWAEEVTRTAQLLTEHGVAVSDALHVGGSRFRSYPCTDESCCPPEGREVPQEASELEVHRVTRGALAVADSRQDVADLYQPRPDLAPSEAVYASQMSISALPLAERCAQAVSDTGDLLRACQAPAERDGDAVRARLGLLLGDVVVRDFLLAVLAQEGDLSAAAHALTWLGLTTAPAYRPPVAATAACLQLAVGDDAVATWALLDLADGESLTALLRAGMEHGVRPDQVHDLLLEALPAIREQITGP